MTEIGQDYSSRWTADWAAPWEAPEYVFTTAIGQALMNANRLPIQIFLEYNLQESIKELKPKGKRGRFFATLPKGARADILIADSDEDESRMCLEVKRCINATVHFRKDVERCCDLIRSTPSGTIDSAASLFLITANSKASLETKVSSKLIGDGAKSKSAKALMKNLATEFELSIRHGEFQLYRYEDDEGEMIDIHWVAGAVKIAKA